MIRRLWNAPGVWPAVLLLALSMTYTTRQAGLGSAGFWWSLLICVVVMAAALTFRLLTDPRLRSPGPHQSPRKSSSLN